MGSDSDTGTEHSVPGIPATGMPGETPRNPVGPRAEASGGRHGSGMLRPVRVEPERVALEEGLKPALRLRLAPSLRAELVLRYRGEGFDVQERGDLVYVARDPELGRELARLDGALERVVRGATYRSLMRSIGERLGYPACCVDAFVLRARRYPERLLARLPGYRAEAYRTARAAWVRRPLARLDPFLGGDEARLVPFEPCRFDCPVARAWADRVFDAVARRDPEGARRLDERLARDVAVCPRGAIAIVSVDPSRRVRAAQPVPRFAGAPPSAADRAAVRALVGRRVRPDGRVGRRLGPEPVVIAFGRA